MIQVVSFALPRVPQSQWPFPNPEDPPEKNRYVEILSEYCKDGWDIERAFILPEGELPTGDATLITRDNAHVLEPDFANWMEEVDDGQPFYAVVVKGRAVSACRTVRRSVRGIEIGVKISEGYRRRGYARRAVAAWCQATRQEELIVFYGTSWSNDASLTGQLTGLEAVRHRIIGILILRASCLRVNARIKKNHSIHPIS